MSFQSKLSVTLDVKDNVSMEMLMEALAPIGEYMSWPSPQIMAAYVRKDPLVRSLMDSRRDIFLGDVQISAKYNETGVRYLNLSLSQETGYSFYAETLQEAARNLKDLTEPGFFEMTVENNDGPPERLYVMFNDPPGYKEYIQKKNAMERAAAELSANGMMGYASMLREAFEKDFAEQEQATAKLPRPRG